DVSSTALNQTGAPPMPIAIIASTISKAAAAARIREGLYSNPIAGADRIHDLLPVRARRRRVAHQPIPDQRIGLAQEFVERCQRVVCSRTLRIEPSTQQRIQFARAATAAPAQALELRFTLRLQGTKLFARPNKSSRAITHKPSRRTAGNEYEQISESRYQKENKQRPENPKWILAYQRQISRYSKQQQDSSQHSCCQSLASFNTRQREIPANHHTARLTINCLISPIACAGFRPFGQVLVQFMMVWQRYSRNGSSRSSRRAPVSSSRESMIQRYACSSTAGPR